MTQALIINSAATGDASVSRQLTGQFAQRLKQRNPALHIVTRDIGAEPIPHLAPETVGAIRGTTETQAQLRTLHLSDSLIDELRDADLIVIGAPMYNFGISSTLKAWFDHVLRGGATFRYTENGPEGLLKGKRAVVIETRGGFYSAGPAAGMDGQEPHLRTMLGFIGITDVVFIRAEKLAMGPEAASAAITEAIEQLDALADNDLALAA